jgi:hypothetical protein
MYNMQFHGQLLIDRTYAVGVFDGRFVGRMPSKELFFSRSIGGEAADRAGKGNIWGGEASPNPSTT